MEDAELVSLYWRRDNSRDKRGGGEAPLALDELAEAVDRFLEGLPGTERDAFVCLCGF